MPCVTGPAWSIGAAPPICVSDALVELLGPGWADSLGSRSRVVEVPASVLAVLRIHVELRVSNDPGVLVFTTPFGDPVRLSNWRHRVWDPLAAELGLPG